MLRAVATANPISGPLTWTPADASGAALSLTSVSCQYEKVGTIIHAYGTFTYPATVDASTAVITLPVGVPNQNYADLLPNQAFTSSSTAALVLIASILRKNTSQFTFEAGIIGGANLTNAQLSGLKVIVNLTYPST